MPGHFSGRSAEAFAGSSPSVTVPEGRTLLYTVGGATAETTVKSGRWKVFAGIGVAVVVAGVAAAVIVSGGEGGNQGAPQKPAATSPAAPAETSAAPDIELSVTAVNDLGNRVELKWSAEGDLDFSVVVAGENIDTMVLVANRQRELSVPVDQGRKYCFQVRATDSRNIYTSEPVPVRGARCTL
ncbi:hypothetical protein [Actinophytocola xinjiangensis]|nr:hypothetical protein [Actinophytocola xinjiangensis]